MGLIDNKILLFIIPWFVAELLYCAIIFTIRTQPNYKKKKLKPMETLKLIFKVIL